MLLFRHIIISVNNFYGNFSFVDNVKDPQKLTAGTASFYHMNMYLQMSEKNNKKE